MTVATEFDAFRSIADGLRRGVRLIVGGAVGGVVLALLILNLTPPEYTASMTVGPTSALGPAAMGVAAPSPGRETATGLAERAVTGEDLSDFSRWLHLIASQPAAESVLADPTLAKGLLRGRWDEARGEWRPPEGPSALVRRLLLSAAGREDWVVPDSAAVARILRDRVVIEPVGTGPIKRVRFVDRDRDFALGLLRAVADAADTRLRTEAARRLRAQIAHIRESLSTVTATDNRRVLTELLAERERSALMIEVDLPYAADVLEPPSAPSRPDRPDAITLIVASLAAGTAAGAFAAGFLTRRRETAGASVRAPLAAENLD